MQDSLIPDSTDTYYLKISQEAGFGSTAVRPKAALRGAGGAGAAGGRAARGAAAEGRSTAASEQTRVTASAQLEKIA